MLVDGIYKIVYAQNRQLEDDEMALAVVRNDQVIASDKNGGVYMSAQVDSVAESLCVITFAATAPPYGVFVTGLEAGPEGADITMTATLDPSSTQQRASVNVAGTKIDVDVVYIGPLPN